MGHQRHFKNIETETCKLLPFAQAILDCDTTSRLHGLGKGIALKRLRGNEQLRENALRFSRIDASKEEINAAGEAALSILYGGESTDNLDSYRQQVFRQKVAMCTTFVHPQNLPPT